MHNHQVKKCSNCDTVISQCRCMDKNKTVIYDLCDKCKDDDLTVEDVKMKEEMSGAIYNPKALEKIK